MEIRLFNALDATSRPRSEVKGRYANMWTRSSGGQSNKLVMAVSEKEGSANGPPLTLVYDRSTPYDVDEGGRKINRWTIGCSKS